MTSTATSLRIMASAALLMTATSAQSGPRMEKIWGGETRQIFTLTDSNYDVHVWTAGDGPRIRHALNPGVSATWTNQTLPADVLQNVLDVHFIPNHELTGPEHYGFACGWNGNVLTTDDYGATWSHLDAVEVENSLTGPENAVLWRNRFLNPEDGFVCGLWTFKRWGGSDWTDVDLVDEFDVPFSADRVEFYALELLVDPGDPDVWTGVAAGQLWGSAGGGGHPGGAKAIVLYGSSEIECGNEWKVVFRDQVDPNDPENVDNPQNLNFDDPWDVEFDPTTSSLVDRVGYLSVGIGTNKGGVYRTADGGQTWDPIPDLITENATLYGITVLNEDNAVAVGYGGQIWVRLVRDENVLWERRRGADPLPLGVTDTETGPLAGAHHQGADVFVTGSWGYCRMSDDLFETNAVDLVDPTSSEGGEEHWRIADIDFTTSTHGYGVSANKTILETTDGGEDWDPSASSPSTLTGSPVHPLAAIDFRTGGGSGVAVGWGDIDTLSPLSTPTVDQAFAYYMHETNNSTWEAGKLASGFNPSQRWLLLGDVAWATGDGGSAEFWAIGLYGDGSSPWSLTSNLHPALLRSTDGGATWVDGEALADTNNVLTSSARLNAIAFQTGANTKGFLVGEDTSGNGVAYRLDLTGAGSPLLVSLSIGSPSNKLNDVTANSSFVIAVGDNESVYRYYAYLTGYAAQSGWPTIDFDSPTNFITVSAPPGSDPRLLIGMATSFEEVDAPGVGNLLYYDAGWDLIPAATNKNPVALVLQTSGGFGVAGQVGNTEVGVVNDSAVLRFVED